MDYVREKINADYETYSGFVLEKWFRQSYNETGEYNIVTNYWKKGTGGAPGEYQEIDLVAVNRLTGLSFMNLQGLNIQPNGYPFRRETQQEQRQNTYCI